MLSGVLAVSDSSAGERYLLAQQVRGRRGLHSAPFSVCCTSNHLSTLSLALSPSSSLLYHFPYSPVSAHVSPVHCSNGPLALLTALASPPPSAVCVWYFLYIEHVVCLSQTQTGAWTLSAVFAIPHAVMNINTHSIPHNGCYPFPRCVCVSPKHTLSMQCVLVCLVSCEIH